MVKNVVKNFIQIGGGFAEKIISQFRNSLEEIKNLYTTKPTQLEKAEKQLKVISRLPTITDLDESDDDLDIFLGI